MKTVSLDVLTPREREVLIHIAEGDSLAEIAQKLSRSLKTVESHRLSIGRKLKASNRVELAKIAIANGLVKLDADHAENGGNGLPHAQQWICDINEAIQQATGRELLQRFCKATSKLPGVDIAAICTGEKPVATDQSDPYSRVIMAASENGRLSKPIRYNAMQTPCQAVIDHGSLAMESGIQQAFPSDPWLVQADAEGYFGLILEDADGHPVGGVGVVSREPMKNTDELREMIDFFAPRLAGAIRACVEIEALRSQNDRLQASLVAPKLNDATGGPVEAATSTAFTHIAQKIYDKAGAKFLSGFLAALCEEFGLLAGGICALERGSSCRMLSTVSFWLEGEQADTLRYDSKGTPCDYVLDNASICLVDNAAESYPEDKILVDYKIRGMCVHRLPSPSGETAGTVWGIDTKPLQHPEALQAIMTYFAPRIGAELSQFLQLEELMQERERLEARLEMQHMKA